MEINVDFINEKSNAVPSIAMWNIRKTILRMGACSSSPFTSCIKLVTVEHQHLQKSGLSRCLSHRTFPLSFREYQVCVNFLFHRCKLAVCKLEIELTHNISCWHSLDWSWLHLHHSHVWYFIKRPKSQCNEFMLLRFEIWPCALST